MQIGRAMTFNAGQGTMKKPLVDYRCAGDQKLDLIVINYQREAIGRREMIDYETGAALGLVQRPPTHRTRTVDNQRQVERGPMRSGRSLGSIGGLHLDKKIEVIVPCGDQTISEGRHNHIRRILVHFLPPRLEISSRNCSAKAAPSRCAM